MEDMEVIKLDENGIEVAVEQIGPEYRTLILDKRTSGLPTAYRRTFSRLPEILHWVDTLAFSLKLAPTLRGKLALEIQKALEGC
jgi:hypothetical protein